MDVDLGAQRLQFFPSQFYLGSLYEKFTCSLLPTGDSIDLCKHTSSNHERYYPNVGCYFLKQGDVLHLQMQGKRRTPIHRLRAEMPIKCFIAKAALLGKLLLKVKTYVQCNNTVTCNSRQNGAVGGYSEQARG